MDLYDRRGLKSAAAEALDHAPRHRKLVLLWIGTSAAVSLLTSLISLLLDTGIASTGGLAGIGTRNILSTVQSVLSLGISLLMPFWTLGYARATLQLGRKEPTQPRTLLSGFHRFGPVLRLLLLQVVLYCAIIMVCFSVGTTILSMTPLANPLYEAMTPLVDMLATGQPISDADRAAVMAATKPMLIGCAVIILIVLIPVFYRLRLANLLLMDDPGCGALAALITSASLMRHRCLAFFRLDLSFWWFYLAEGLIVVLCYGDSILPAVGVSLPISSDAAYFLFYAAAMALQVGLYWGVRNRVSVTYALAYDTIRGR